MHGVVDLKHSGRSLIYNKNNNGPKIEP